MKPITPELQKRIEKARAEIQRRKKDNEWGGLCIATKMLVSHGFKDDARKLIREHLKLNQR